MRTTFPPPSGPRGRVAVSLLMAAPLLLAGCQLIGGGGPSPSGPETAEAVSGQSAVYQGVLSMDGGDIPAALEIVREGGRNVRGALQATSGLQADGEGRIRGETLTLDLVYGGDCPGRMHLEGEWDEDSRIYEGVVEAQDCTGRGQGTFRFSAS